MLATEQIAYWQNGNPTMSPVPTPIGVGKSYYPVSIGDFDNDGQKDIRLQNYYSLNLVVWYSANPSTSVSLGMHNPAFDIVGLPGEFCQVGGCF